MNMMYQRRVVDEYEALLEKTLKLGRFLDTQVFFDLDSEEKERLIRQWKVMQEYGLILSQRIGAFKS